MDKTDVISRFCRLSDRVLSGVYNYSKDADCFCGERAKALRNAGQLVSEDYRFSEAILDFIEQAIEEKISRTEQVAIDI